MNKVSRKIILDIVMTGVYLVLLFGRDVSPLFHEVAGIGIGVLFILHIAWNKDMFRGLKAQQDKGRATVGQQVLFVLDLLLPVAMLVAIGTGVAVSSELFVFNLGTSYMAVAWIHNFVSYLCLGIMVLHLALHAKYLAAVCKALVGPKGRGAMLHTSKRFVAIAAALVMFYATVSFAYERGMEVGAQEAERLALTEESQRAKADELNGDTEPEAEGTIPEESEKEEEPSSVAPQEEQPKDDAVQLQPETTEPEVTLEEYLSGLTCTACHKQCSLLSPRCGRGRQQAEDATAEYEATYK